MPEPGFPVFDADNHLYESPDMLTEYLPKQYARDIQFVQVRGRPRIAVKGTITDYMPNPTFERVAAPGAHVDFYRGTNTEGKSLREMSGEPIDCLPAFREPGPRLAMLDELHVHRALVFPTLANLLEYTLDGDPDLTHAAVHAVNEWLYDVWSFDYHDRIFTVPVVTLPIVEEAIKELDWVLEHGAKAVLIRPAPVTGLRGSRSFALPEFDPVWARLQEAEVPVCLHASFPPLTSYYEKWEPGRSDNAFTPTPLEDALAALVCQGALTRFPDLKVVSVENGANWVAHLLEQLGLAYGRMPQSFDEHPVEAFRRNVYVNPFWEDDVANLVELIGVEHVLFGSDYPHPEGLAAPLDYLDYLAEYPGLDDHATRRIMSDNANELLGLS
jgi:predicted TIM-barrel fold metal-dependent hydrolase